MKHCYIIGEAGLNHNGSLDLALQLIDCAAVAGADAVKFQKRTVDKLAAESTLNAEDTRFPSFGNTYREIREHLEFSMSDYKALKKYAKSKNLDFIVTAFDIDSVDFLDELGVDRYKLASHSLTNIPLLRYIAARGRKVILSTGMCTLEEMDAAVSIFQNSDCDLEILHCVSAYPTPLELCNIQMLDTLKKRYGLTTGYSGHEIGYLATLVAVSRGADIVERHITLDKSMIGFDHKISLDPNELRSMVADIRTIEQIIGNGEKSLMEAEHVTRGKYHVSMVSATSIPKGTRLESEFVVYRNPGTGIPYSKSHLILGKRAAVDIPANELLLQEMFSDE